MPAAAGVVVFGAASATCGAATGGLPNPLIPLRFFTNRTRVASNVASLALYAPFIGYVVLLTWYMQQVLGYSPLKTGLLYLPFGVGIGAGLALGFAVMPRIGVKAVLSIGFAGSAAGLLVASYIRVNSSYPGGILPGLIVFGVFSGRRGAPGARGYPRLRAGVPYRRRRARRCRGARPGAAGTRDRQAADRTRRGLSRPGTSPPVGHPGHTMTRVPGQ